MCVNGLHFGPQGASVDKLLIAGRICRAWELHVIIQQMCVSIAKKTAVTVMSV